MKELLNCILALCLLSGAEKTFAQERPPIQIGTIFILTGEGSSWGTASANGVSLAVEKINSEGGLLGRRVEVVQQDDQGDPKKSITAFRQLVDVNGIRFIIGPTWSNLGIPLIDLALQEKVVMISPSLGVAKFNEANRFLFNTWPHDSILSEKLADYVYSKGGRNVALVGAQHVWVQEQTAAFRKRFEALGGTVGFQTEPLPGSVDLKTEALKIKNKPGIDAVVSTTDGVIVGSLVAKALKELNVKLPMYSITLDQASIDASQGGFEGLQFLTFLTPSPAFKARYEARFKTNIDIGADSAYDAVMLLAKAIRETKSADSETVADYLGTVKVYDGESGNLTSDGKRGFTKALAVKKVENGFPRDF